MIPQVKLKATPIVKVTKLTSRIIFYLRRLTERKIQTVEQTKKPGKWDKFYIQYQLYASWMNCYILGKVNSKSNSCKCTHACCFGKELSMCSKNKFSIKKDPKSRDFMNCLKFLQNM